MPKKKKFDYRSIDSYEAACKDQGKNPEKFPDYSECEMTPKEEQYQLSTFKSARIATSINKDEDGNEWKPIPGEDYRYYTWQWIKKDDTKRSGFGLSLRDVHYDDSDAFVASRLQFRDEGRARFFFDTYPELLEDIMIPQFE